MKEPVKNNHRIIDCEEHAVFMFDDGIDVLGKSAVTKTCLNCSHSELPYEGKDAIDLLMNESHQNPLFPALLHNRSREFL